MKLMSKAEIEFGKLGYLKHERNRVIVYYRPYDQEDIRVDDITFLKDAQKIIFYQGSEMGSDAYRLDYKVLNAINLQAQELWENDTTENED